MRVKVLQAKISNAIITEANESYRGSITIDEDILDDMCVLPWQVCDVNLQGGDQDGRSFRGTTYILAGKRGTGMVEANGALAQHMRKGDMVHINVYCDMDYGTAKEHKPIIIESNIPYF